AKVIVTEYGVEAALIKGGHIKGVATDFLYDGNEFHTFSADRVDTTHTHDTWSTLSAAITSYISQGYSLEGAVDNAKKYVTLAIQHSLALGNGSGPTNHLAPRIRNE